MLVNTQLPIKMALHALTDMQWFLKNWTTNVRPTTVALAELKSMFTTALVTFIDVLLIKLRSLT